MFNKKFQHWNSIEESKDRPYFDGSLHSKMSNIKITQDIWDLLKGIKRNFYNPITEWASRVLKDALKKEFQLNEGGDFNAVSHENSNKVSQYTSYLVNITFQMKNQYTFLLRIIKRNILPHKND